jgi:uncharacterized protein (TIGR00251 family)
VGRKREQNEEATPATPVAAGPVILQVYVQPRASRTELAGRHGDALKIRINAPPVDGAANAELVRFLAERLALPRSAVRIVTGGSTRRKRVEISGASPETLARLTRGADR